jgi:hypothetical protein
MKEQDSRTYFIKYKTIKEILGPINQYAKNDSYITPKLITNYLNRLNFKFTYDESN